MVYRVTERRLQRDSALRERILDLMAIEGITDASADDVVTTTGSQHALDLVSKLFLNPGDVVIAEARTRAERLIGLASGLVERFDGVVPQGREALMTLPGVGRKTANVVMNTAFGEETFAVDTHIFRVGNRTGIAKGKTPLAVEKQLEKRVQERTAQLERTNEELQRQIEERERIELALREAREETGLDPAGVHVLGTLPPLPVTASRRGSRPSRDIAKSTRVCPSISTITTVVSPASAPTEMTFAAQCTPLASNAVARLA